MSTRSVAYKNDNSAYLGCIIMSPDPYFCPRHEMAEGHIEFTLSVCVCVCVCLFVYSRIVSGPAINQPYVMGFENNLAQIIIMTRRYVANKNHVARSKVNVTVRT